MIPGSRFGGGVMLLALCAGCATLRGRGALCEPTSGVLPVGASVEAMAGHFRITLVATAGTAAGQTATAEIHLQPPPAGSLRLVGAPDARMELLGTTTIVPESIGAVNLGGLNQADTLAPGVGVVVQRAAGSPPSVILRIGSAGTRRDVIQYDGGYFALFASQLDERGFAGSWRSGVAAQPPAGGHFCAVRVGS